MTPRGAEQGTVEGRLIRGGTSRGLFVREGSLPVDLGDDRLDALALELFGSPDPIQVDGIGGGRSHTSKLMVVDPGDRDGIDLRYTFGQVGVDRAVVDWSGNCGNLTAAVGVFGLLEGLVDPDDGTTDLTLYNTNTDTVVEQTVPMSDGTPRVRGEYHIDGVAGTGARIDSAFRDPAGGVLGSLFPTGHATDDVSLDGRTVEVSLVDVANPCVFVRASDIGLEGDELPAALSADPGLLERFERIRGAVCERAGIVEEAADARTESPTTPFIAAVAPPMTYDCTVDRTVHADDVDVTARIITTGTPHHAYAMTGAMCLAAAARLPGTIPNAVARTDDDGPLAVGHPKGTIDVGVDATRDAVESVTVGRTARPLFDGAVCYRYVAELESLR